MKTASPPSVLLYADCPVFGGSDHLVAHLLGDRALSEKFAPYLVYRRNARFEAGLKRLVPNPALVTAVQLHDRQEWLDRLEARMPGSVLRWPFKMFLRLFDYFIFPFVVLRLAQVFRRRRPAVVHINSGGYPGALGCRAAAIAARLAGARKVIFGVNNLTPMRRMPWELLDFFIDTWVIRSVDVFVTASKAARRALIERGFPEERVRQIVNGVRAHEAARKPAEIRSELGLSADQVLIVMTAFFEPRKGHRVLVDAIQKIAAKKDSPEFRCLLIGDGPEREAVERAAADAGLKDRFIFLGYRADAADILSAGDVLVLPSIGSEDMPLAVLDAMALSKPVVASAIAGIVEEIESGKTGLLVAPGDAGELAEALGTMLGDAGKRRAMGEAGRRRFEESFEAGICVGRYVELYRRLLNGSGSSGRNIDA